MTRALAANGASKDYILGLRLEALETAAAEFPGVIVLHKADLTSKTDLQVAVDRIKAEAGYINLVVAKSGSIGPPVRFTQRLLCANCARLCSLISRLRA